MITRDGWQRFVARHGWRAYALPVLSVVTVVALIRPGDSSAAESHPTATPKRAVTHSTPHVTPPTRSSAPTSTACVGNQYAKLVLVSISKQHLWACAGAKQLNDAAVTTGRLTDNLQTPFGSWRVQGKERNRYLVGPGYRQYVRYWVPFNGDFGLHDAPWQTMPFGSSGWRTQGSHGCVHTPMTVMAWLYRWVQVDDTVVTIAT